MRRYCGVFLIGCLVCFASVLFLNAYALAEVRLDSVTPASGTLGDDLNIVLKGSGFDPGMRITMNRDTGFNEASVAIPGDFHDVFVADQIAYVTEGTYRSNTGKGVQVVDISDPWAPHIVGAVDTPGSAQSIFVSGQTAYVADGDKGLRIIDVGTPSSPRVVGWVDTPGSARDVVVVDSTAYVADGDRGLQVIDVSLPASPRIVGSVDTPGSAYGVTVSDQTVYVADWDGVQIVDVSNPSSPRIIGSLTLTGLSTPYGGSKELMMSGRTLFVLHASFFYIVDVSDASAPEVISEMALPGSGSISMEGDIVYVTEKLNGVCKSVNAIDVKNLAAPWMIGSVPMFSSGASSGGGIMVIGKIAWVAHSAGLVALDVRNPFPKTHSFLYASGENFEYHSRGTIYDVSIVSNTAYVADYTGLLLVDTNPSAFFPRVIGAVDTPQPAKGVFIKGELAYVTCGAPYSYADQSLQIINISDPSMPEIIGAAEFAESDKINGIAVQGNFAYVVTESYTSSLGKMHIVDVGNPAAPAVVGSVTTPDDARDVKIEGPFAYVVAEEAFQVINISNPSAPAVLGVLELPHDLVMRLSVNGNFAFLLDDNGTQWDGKLYGVDISDPSNPVKMTALDLAGQPRDIAREGNTLYILTCKRLENDESRGVLTVVDITSPSEPRIIDTIYPSRFVDHDSHMIDGLAVENELVCAGTGTGEDLAFIDVGKAGALKPFVSLQMPGYVKSVGVSGQTAVVADGNIQIVDIQDPLYPELIRTVETDGDAENVQLAGQLAYTNDGAVIDISDPSAAKIVYDVGNMMDYAVSGNFLYTIGYGSEGFIVINMTDPKSPQTIATMDTNMGCEPYMIRLAGDVAVVTTDCGDSTYIDVSDPFNPKKTGVPDWPQEGVVKGNTAYKIENATIQVLDLGVPASPRIMESIKTPGEPLDLDVAGRFAFVADGKAGLTVIPVTQVTEITDFVVQDSGTVSMEVSSPAVHGDYALRIINGDDSDLLPGAIHFVDASPPAIKHLQDDINPCESKTWAWTTDEPAEFRFVVNQSATWVPEGPFSQLSTTAGISDVKGTWYLHVQARDLYGNVSDVFTVSALLDNDGDLDNDNLPDDWEIRYFGNLDQTAEADTDGDGFNNLDEYKYGSKPDDGTDIPDLALSSVIPNMGILGQGFSAQVKGSGFTDAVRVYMGPDLRNLGSIIGSVLENDGIYGDLYDVEVAGDIAYVLDGRYLRAIDVTDPADPKAIGSSPSLDEGRDIFIVNNFAYVADEEGLQIIDISEPDNLSLYSRTGSVTTPGNACGVVVVGSHAYVADGGTLQVVDVRDPAAPVIVGSVGTSGGTVGLAAGAQVIYAASGNRLDIIDVTDPEVPYIIDSVGSFWNARAVSVVGQKAYVVDNDGLGIIDVSDPYASRSLGNIGTPEYAWDVVVAGQTAYVTCADSFYANSASLQVIDVSDPDIPRSLGAVASPAGAQGLCLVERTAYVAAGNSGGLQIIDVSTPENYEYVGSVLNLSGSAEDVAVVGDIAYVSNYQGFHIVDVSDPAGFRMVGSVSTPMYSRGFTLSDQKAYVACSGWSDGGYLVIIDVSDSSSPRIIKSVPTPGRPWDVKVAGSVAYVADGGAGLQIINVSDPSAARLVGHVDTTYSARGVDVIDNIACVADDRGGFQIVDVSDPATPFITGTAAVSFANDVRVVNQLAYVADGSYGLKIIDVSDAALPRIVGAVRGTGSYERLTVKDQRVYAAAGNGGVDIIDVTDSAAPRYIASLYMPDAASGITVVGKTAYVAAGGGGLVAVPIIEEVVDVKMTGSDTMELTLTSPATTGNFTLHVANQNDSFSLHGAVSFLAMDYVSTGDLAPFPMGDGRVTILDVLMALRHVAGNASFQPWQVAVGDVAPIIPVDASPGWAVEGDGRITMQDVMVLLKASVGQLQWAPVPN